MKDIELRIKSLEVCEYLNETEKTLLEALQQIKELKGVIRILDGEQGTLFEITRETFNIHHLQDGDESLYDAYKQALKK